MIVASVAAITHVGVVRTENQDCLHVAGWSSRQSGARLTMDLEAGGVLAVIDGMGGHVGGALASWSASRALGDLRLDTATGPSQVNRLVQGVSDAVREQGQLTEGHAAMGATIAGLVLGPAGLLIFNVGDCSILRLRDGYAGQLAVIDRVGDPDRPSVIGQCLGGSPQPTAIDAHADWFHPVDVERLVLCSDGLTDCVTTKEIVALAEAPVPIDDAARALIAAAVRNGAPDNVSVIVADVADRSEVAADSDDNG
ncbi:serine/threonine-protein phosphatase [Nocardioides immobilis]|uniref:Serine/threonine-protein phosphatase n=1 Tax=Nocardioides immobilis TaxID=2049295 RepID=A0A417XYH7_9ACTN|nr:PP2C family serine/threonine-protein phosphatase [Nocardioides immobilis]RHW25415.1 serine/threonine-protein phosphatase [Nocardioides immobilis]